MSAGSFVYEGRVVSASRVPRESDIGLLLDGLGRSIEEALHDHVGRDDGWWSDGVRITVEWFSEGGA